MVLTASMLLSWIAYYLQLPLSEPTPVSETEIVVPVSPALRAASTGSLKKTINTPVTHRFVCLVTPSGVPGACLPYDETPIPKSWTTAQFSSQSRDFYEKTLPRIDHDGTMRIALEYAHLTRLKPISYELEANFEIESATLKIFTETVYPTDGNIEAEESPLSFKQIQIISGLDPALIQTYYAPVFTYKQVFGEPPPPVKVSVLCRVQDDYGLLCHDGKIMSDNVLYGRTFTSYSTTMFIHGTYQALSLVKIAPQTNDGQDTLGKDVAISILYDLSVDARTLSF